MKKFLLRIAIVIVILAVLQMGSEIKQNQEGFFIIQQKDCLQKCLAKKENSLPDSNSGSQTQQLLAEKPKTEKQQAGA